MEESEGEDDKDEKYDKDEKDEKEDKVRVPEFGVWLYSESSESEVGRKHKNP